MATSNRDRVGRGFESLAAGLEPWIDAQMRSVAPGPSDWVAAVVAASGKPQQVVATSGPQFQLKVLWDQWNAVFGKVLGQSERTLVSRLRTARNDWAHVKPFSFEAAYRALDDMEQLLTAAAAPQAADVGAARKELLRVQAEVDRKREAAVPPAAELAIGSVGGLRPWREVITPHRDVASGEYTQAEFAANLEAVVSSSASGEYSDPVEFFRRTFLTQGLRELLVTAALRLSGTGGAPVVDLQTSFGGGKTHSMLALYHLCSGTPLSALPAEVGEVLARAGVTSLPMVRRVVLVGTAIPPASGRRKADGTHVKTLWGELAWQLGGREGYDLVAVDDAARTSPGERLGELFRRYGPCLVLIDEWVAYARHLYTRDDLDGGSLDAQMSFAQALTEQAASVPGTLVVVSIPASSDGSVESESRSAVEVGGAGGREALRRLRSAIGRMEASWRPASSEESFEIVRRRLFDELPVDRLADRDAAARTFCDFYRTQGNDFPSECRDPTYLRRIQSAYPVHPELFDRLYDDWSTLERFQRTRGVLRLMAAVIHALWMRDDKSPLILPASIPLDDSAVLTELEKHLPDSWKSIIDSDIDGPGSTPVELDRAQPSLGRYSATRRVARTIFVGSAPRTGGANKGIETQRIRLGCAIPGETVATFGDALNRLAERSTYLYQEGPRYWYGVQPSVTRRAQEIAERYRIGQREELHARIVQRLRADRERGDFVAVHAAPAGSAEVPDDDGCRLVVLHPKDFHVRGAEASPALLAAREVFERRGSSARVNRNALIFLAADQRGADELEQAVADLVAWTEIDGDAEVLSLDAAQARQARDRKARADESVDLRTPVAYQWALVPTQADPTGPIEWKTLRIDGPGPLAAKVSKKLVREGDLALRFPSLSLRIALEGPLSTLWSDGHVGVGALWDCFSKYVYLPRLRDETVLAAAVQDGPAAVLFKDEGYAVASRFDEETSRYLGLAVGSPADLVDARHWWSDLR